MEAGDRTGFTQQQVKFYVRLFARVNFLSIQSILNESSETNISDNYVRFLFLSYSIVMRIYTLGKSGIKY